MRAVSLSAHGDVQVLDYLEDQPIPKIKKGHVLVKNVFSSLNFVDIYFRSGLYHVSELPTVLGTEGVGEIVEIGLETPSNLSVGDRVVYIASGSYAEYTLVPALMLVPLPPSISCKTAATYFLQGLTALYLTEFSYKVQPGTTALVTAAAGGVGTLLTQLCKLRGATVIGTTSTAEKAAKALRNGCDHVVNYRESSVEHEVMRLTANQGVDVVFDGVGRDTLESSLNSLAYFGTLVSYGNASGKPDPLPLEKLAAKCLKLTRPSLFGAFDYRAALKGGGPVLLEKLASELFRLVESENLVQEVYRVYSIEKTKEAQSDLESGRTTGKLLLSFE